MRCARHPNPRQPPLLPLRRQLQRHRPPQRKRHRSRTLPLHPLRNRAPSSTQDFSPDADGKSDYYNTTLYTGREFDPETGLMYYRARYYHTELGRFVARDPIGYEGGISLYEYALSSPLLYTDSSGQIPLFYADVIREANRRRGHGPWKDSAQHCWTACYLGARYGYPLPFGTAAATCADIGEVVAPSDDSVRDSRCAAHRRNCW